jgi:hypothetical protein
MLVMSMLNGLNLAPFGTDKVFGEQRGSAEQSKPYPLVSSFSALTKTGDQANIFADLPQIANLQPALAVQASQFR